MARTAIVSSSVVLETGRLDASFHVLLAEFSERIEILETAVSPDEAMELVKSLARQDLTPLAALSRGEGHGNAQEKVMRAVERHPYLALAVVERHLVNVKERVSGELQKGQSYLAELDRIDRVLADIPDANQGLHPGR